MRSGIDPLGKLSGWHRTMRGVDLGAKQICDQGRSGWRFFSRPPHPERHSPLSTPVTNPPVTRRVSRRVLRLRSQIQPGWQVGPPQNCVWSLTGGLWRGVQQTPTGAAKHHESLRDRDGVLRCQSHITGGAGGVLDSGQRSRPVRLNQSAIGRNNFRGQLRFHPGQDRKSTRLNSSHIQKSRMPSSA